MTQRDMAGFLGIDTKTLYNWRKEKPNLYKTIVLGLKMQEFQKIAKEQAQSLEKFVEAAEESLRITRQK